MLAEKEREANEVSARTSGKLEKGVINCAVCLGMLANTREEAESIAKDVSYAIEQTEKMSPADREEFLGKKLADMYEKASEKMATSATENYEEASKRLKETAQTLAEAYDSPTCRAATKNRIDKIVTKEEWGEMEWQTLDREGNSLDHLSQAFAERGIPTGFVTEGVEGLLSTVGKLRAAAVDQFNKVTGKTEQGDEDFQKIKPLQRSNTSAGTVRPDNFATKDTKGGAGKTGSGGF